jgi:hypothetical protein
MFTTWLLFLMTNAGMPIETGMCAMSVLSELYARLRRIGTPFTTERNPRLHEQDLSAIYSL